MPGERLFGCGGLDLDHGHGTDGPSARQYFSFDVFLPATATDTDTATDAVSTSGLTG